MGASLGQLVIEILIKRGSAEEETKHLEGNLQSVENKAKQTSQQLSNMGNTGKQSSAGFGSGLALNIVSLQEVISLAKEFGASCEEAFLKADTANSQLLFSLKNDSEAFERVEKFAASFSKTSGSFSETEIKSAASFLAAEGRTTEEIQKMITAGANLQTIRGGDLKENVTQVNMTMEGMVGRLTRLDAKFGEFDDTQLKSGAAVDYINKKFGGFAENMGNTYAGKIQHYKNIWEETEVSITSGALKSFETDLDNTKESTEDLADVTKVLGTALGFTLGTLAKFATPIGVVIGFVRSLANAWHEVKNELTSLPRLISDFQNRLKEVGEDNPIVVNFLQPAIDKAAELFGWLASIVGITNGAAKNISQQTGIKIPEAKEPTANLATVHSPGSGKGTKEEKNAVDELLKSIKNEVDNLGYKKTLTEDILRKKITEVENGKSLAKGLEDENKLLAYKEELLKQIADMQVEGKKSQSKPEDTFGVGKATTAYVDERKQAEDEIARNRIAQIENVSERQIALIKYENEQRINAVTDNPAYSIDQKQTLIAQYNIDAEHKIAAIRNEGLLQGLSLMQQMFNILNHKPETLLQAFQQLLAMAIAIATAISAANGGGGFLSAIPIVGGLISGFIGLFGGSSRAPSGGGNMPVFNSGSGSMMDSLKSVFANRDIISNAASMASGHNIMLNGRILDDSTKQDIATRGLYIEGLSVEARGIK